MIRNRLWSTGVRLNGGGALDGLAATAMRYLAGNGGNGAAAGKLPEPKDGQLPSGPTTVFTRDDGIPVAS
jgi:hypothetical protein